MITTWKLTILMILFSMIQIWKMLMNKLNTTSLQMNWFIWIIYLCKFTNKKVFRKRKWSIERSFLCLHQFKEPTILESICLNLAKLDFLWTKILGILEHIQEISLTLNKNKSKFPAFQSDEKYKLKCLLNLLNIYI